MKQKAVRILSMLFAVVMVIASLTLGMMAVASAESAATAAATAPAIDWGALVTQIVVWIIGAIAAVGAWALKKYVYPWFLTAAVPWLKTHNLVVLAEMAVKYAEAELGRYTGEEKWKLAIALMQAKGFDVDSEEVIAALKAAWETLDLQQISAGVKNTSNKAID
ncbi:MAG: hypothetical protein VB104_07575 [Candidatus Limiplasma sp.]|nr:hypothetical protein [Candidatus Limiplasma sp.]